MLREEPVDSIPRRPPLIKLNCLLIIDKARSFPHRSRLADSLR